MEIRCRCSGCQAKFKVDAKYAGKKARCPKCQTVVEVPRENLEESTVVNMPAPTVAGLTSPAQPAPPPSGAWTPPPLPGRPGPAYAPQPAPAPQPTPAPAAFAPVPSRPDPSFAPQLQSPAQPQPQPAAQQPAFEAAASPAPLFSTPAGPSTGLSPSAKAGKKAAGPSNPLPMILGIGGGLIAIVAIGVTITVMSMGPTYTRKPVKRPKPGAVATNSSGTLLIDWPDDERAGASLTIDGQKKTVLPHGPLRFLLSAGSHRLSLLRRGFEPVESEVTLASGQTQTYRPQWRAGSVGAPVAGTFTPPASGTSGNNTSPPAGGFPIGTAVASLSPQGFAGWSQNFDAAKRQAAQESKNILLVFGCSDAQSATRELARQLEQAGVKNNQVCVIIDFPRTEDGFNIIEDRGQNEQLLEEFGLDRLPALALADEKGRTFFLKREWEDGFANLATRLATWTAERARRDELLAAAEPNSADKLPAAAAAVKWLQDNKVWRFYRSEINGWHAAAMQADPDNAQSLLETFFEPRWFIDAQAINENDSGAATRVVAELDPWVGRGFKDHDRGAKLHMTAAMLLARAQKFDDATRQLEHAVKYSPKDPKLADALTGLKSRLENKDVLGSGTGYLVSSAGYIMTNHHVIDGPGRVEVRLPGTKDNIPATVIAQDEHRDMALIKVDLPQTPLLRPVAVVKDDTGLASEVAAFGFPLSDELGSSLKFTKGSISDLPGGANDKYILDVKVNPGNSGGPLCNTLGNVVGMVTAKTTNTQLEDSYGLAIPAEVLLEFMDAHLPADAPRADPNEAEEPWTAVARKMTTSVLMIVKKK
ncbi:MAG: trypsin-like peptidase domain-containing protein [Pirellulaceae bacterium]|nr:trypsin-like peptidase domain-containing protein [Pirellulaceae bacterium]